MSLSTFLKRLDDRKVNDLVYALSGREGLVSVWKHEGSLILTWEECPAGEQYNESTYTRDERHVFDAASKLLEFLTVNELKIESFAP